jgi:cytochrome c
MYNFLILLKGGAGHIAASLRIAFRAGVIMLAIISGFSACIPAWAQMRGHGGPIRALAISPDGKNAISGSFDSSAIRWSLSRGVAEQVLRFHESAVNAVVYAPDGRIVTGGEDGRIAIWQAGAQVPATVLTGHTAPIVALAVSPDGRTLASASWDRTVRLWPLASGGFLSSIFGSGNVTARVLEGHQQNVNGVAFASDGKALVSVGYDLTLRIWPLSGGAESIVPLPAPLNAVTAARDGEIIAGAADGRVFFLSATGELRGELAAAESPIISLALSPDGTLIAAAGIRGSVSIIERMPRKLARTLVGPGLPVWSTAFMPDNRTLLTGGTDRLVRRWDVLRGEHLGSVAMVDGGDPLAAYKGDRGAEVFRACVACHTLSRDDGIRAGPTLAGIYGRKIASLPGYDFSPALKKLNIVWTPDTVAKLFEVGPMEYTPGTKMPEQKIGSREDREALVKFLEKATKN